jgi:hypothetical protein
MKIIYLLISLFLSCLTCAALADDCVVPLNKVSMDLRAEQWVTTQTALVNVLINASVTNRGIEKVQNEIMGKLNQLSKADWHLVSLNRSADQSGLENVQITAQARLNQSELASLRDRAKGLTRPGETFVIDSIQFAPSEDEMRQANSNLRANIYQQAKIELASLNKVYPEQKYYLHEVDFSPPPVTPMAETGLYAARMASDNGMTKQSPLSVGNKLELRALVTFASLSNLPQ